jgi:hypothetical protein
MGRSQERCCFAERTNGRLIRQLRPPHQKTAPLRMEQGRQHKEYRLEMSRALAEGSA